MKSKSMATEEIHLNAAPRAGTAIRVKETDLGEWIIQLAGQKPSHMVMPAIHMTKEEVAEIFSKEVKERLAADIPRLVEVARSELRQEFLQADLGITGANIAVAETGTLVILTNEGNARLVTTLPPIHVAVVGIEKLVERFADVEPIVKALPKSATGQLLTSYVSMITGPRARTRTARRRSCTSSSWTTSGPRWRRTPTFAQALRCIRCASCLNVCPVFRLVGGHVFGAIYTGGIGTILTAWFDALKAAKDIQGLCIQCGNCTQVCPTRIDIPELIVELRRRLAREEGRPLVAEGRLRGREQPPRCSTGCSGPRPSSQKPFAKDGFVRHLPLFLSGRRRAPLAAGHRRRAVPRPREEDPAAGAGEGEGGVLRRVPHRLRLPGVGEAVVKVLGQGRRRGRLPGGADLLRRAGALRRRLRRRRAEREGQRRARSRTRRRGGSCPRARPAPSP